MISALPASLASRSRDDCTLTMLCFVWDSSFRYESSCHLSILRARCVFRTDSLRFLYISGRHNINVYLMLEA